MVLFLMGGEVEFEGNGRWRRAAVPGQVEEATPSMVRMITLSRVPVAGRSPMMGAGGSVISQAMGGGGESGGVLSAEGAPAASWRELAWPGGAGYAGGG